MNWPLEADCDDNVALAPPWDSQIDLSDPATETAVLALQYLQPALVLKVCRSAYLSAQAKGDEQTAIHALYLASIHLSRTSQRALADRVFGLVRERATNMRACSLSVRIEINHAKQVAERGEYSQAMALWQRALDTAMALGDNRVVFVALGCLAHSALMVDDAELALWLCEQQARHLPRDDILWVNFYSIRANMIALALMKIAGTRSLDGDTTAAQRAWCRARRWALLACARSTTDSNRLQDLDTMEQVLLESGQATRAQAEVDRLAARLSVMPNADRELWYELKSARARIEVLTGRVGPGTLKALAVIDGLPRGAASDLQLWVRDARQVLLQAYEQHGRHEQALACHKRLTDWMAQRRSAQARQRTKALRQTVLAMRAEAMEFVTHDLLTPLAAAQTWSQSLQPQLPSASAPALRSAQRLLADAAAFSAQYLCCMRAELMPRTQLQRLDIGALADDVCENSVPALSSGVRLRRTIDIGTPVLGDTTLLTKALAVLLADAFAHAPAGTQVDLSLAHDAQRGVAVLSIGHSGAGPARSTRMQLYQHVLDRDSLTDKDVGLAVSVCRLHCMRLRFATVGGQGSVLRLTIKTEARAPS
jgi:signal transduction histidine kinase